jgi:hypothetical protein
MDEVQGYAPPVVHKSSDSGLSGLGLIMQLVGNIMTAVVGCYGMITVIALLEAGGRGGAPGGMMLFIFAGIGTSLARSVVHAAAGRSLLYELGAGTPMSSLNRYLIVSAVQTGVIALFMLMNDVPGKFLLAVVLMLSAWPVALALVAKPKIIEHGNVVPMADDKGFEGASILMLIFGCIGLGIGAIMLMGWLDWPGEMKSSLMGVGMLAAFTLLTVRSVMHLRAGLRGSSATLMAETAEAAAKYASFGIIASVITGGVFFIGMISSIGGRGGGAMMMLMMFMVVMMTWVLLVWPLIVKRFFGDRQFATMVDERAPSQQASSDRGLPALGWLLLAFGAWALASGFSTLLMGNMNDEDGGMRMGRGDNPLSQMMGMMGNVGGKSPWFGIVTAVLQIWAGVEMIKLSPRFKIAGMVFGGAASAIALYVYLPLIGDLMSGGLAMISNPLAGMMFASVMMALVVPVATFIFVQRKVRDPKALANTFE